MKNLTNHIISLLRLYDHVELPGYGVFALSYYPARLVKESNRFYPPYFSVSFRAEAVSDSEALLASYMRKEQISAEKAKAMLENDLSRLQSLLEKQGAVALPGLGILGSDEGNIMFTPDLGLNLSLPEIPLKDEVEEAPSDTPMEIASEADRPEAEIREVIPQHYHYHNPSYYYLPIHKTFARFAACLILVIVVGVAALIPLGTINSPSSTASMLPMEINKDKRENQKSSSAKPQNRKTPVKRNEVKETVSAPAPIETNEPVDTVISQIETPAAVTVTEPEAVNVTPALAEKPLKEEVKPQPAPDKYYAVVAAFKSEKEANKYIEQNKNKDSRLRITMKSKIRLITVASSNVKEDLERRMPDIRTSYPDAWIYTRP